MLKQYRQQMAERAAMGIVARPLDASQMTGLVELLKQPPVGEEALLLDLLINRVPAGVDEAAQVNTISLRRSPAVMSSHLWSRRKKPLKYWVLCRRL